MFCSLCPQESTLEICLSGFRGHGIQCSIHSETRYKIKRKEERPLERKSIISLHIPSALSEKAERPLQSEGRSYGPTS